MRREKKDRKHENKNKKMKRGKMNFLFCHENFDFGEKSTAKKSEKCSKNWKKNKRAKKDIHRTFFHNEAFLKRTKRKAEKRRETA